MASLCKKYLFTNYCNYWKLTGKNFFTASILRRDKTAPIENKLALMPKKKIKHKKLLEKTTITLKTPFDDVSMLSGVPKKQLQERRVRIHIVPKNAMQSGTANCGYWSLAFDNIERWENPLMGWCSSADPVSSLKLEFATKEEAIRYCDRQGWKWYIIKTSYDKPKRPKLYAEIYSWNKRTRASTK